MRNEKFYYRLDEGQHRIAYAVDLIQTENKLGNKDIHTVEGLKDYMVKREAAHLVTKYYGYPDQEELIDVHTRIHALEIEELLEKHPEMIPSEWARTEERSDRDGLGIL